MVVEAAAVQVAFADFVQPFQDPGTISCPVLLAEDAENLVDLGESAREQPLLAWLLPALTQMQQLLQLPSPLHRLQFLSAELLYLYALPLLSASQPFRAGSSFLSLHCIFDFQLCVRPISCIIW